MDDTNETSKIAKNNSQKIGPVAENSSGANTNTPPVKPGETNCAGDESDETNCADLPEMPSDSGQTGLGDGQTAPSGEQVAPGAGRMPMMPGGGFPSTITVSDTNEWLIPMTCTGIVSGVVVIAAAVVCLLTYKFTRGIKKDATKSPREKRERDGAHYNG